MTIKRLPERTKEKAGARGCRMAQPNKKGVRGLDKPHAPP